jgi:hypothetical protein
MAEFLTDAWFDRARELTAVEPALPGVGFRIQFDAEGRRWHVAAEDGAITEWAAGDIDDPDVEVRLPLEVARSYYRGEADGTETLASCRVIEPGGEEGPPSPLDIEERSELAEMAYQPDATLLTQYRFSAGPFGAFEWWWRFIDGQSDSMGLGQVDEPDAVVKVAFQKQIGVRTDAISIYEALEGGRIDGDVGPLMLLAGLLEDPDLHAAELACGASGPAFSCLGLVVDQPQVRDGLEALAGETD